MEPHTPTPRLVHLKRKAKVHNSAQENFVYYQNVLEIIKELQTEIDCCINDDRISVLDAALENKVNPSTLFDTDEDYELFGGDDKADFLRNWRAWDWDFDYLLDYIPCSDEIRHAMVELHLATLKDIEMQFHPLSARHRWKCQSAFSKSIAATKEFVDLMQRYNDRVVQPDRD